MSSKTFEEFEQEFKSDNYIVSKFVLAHRLKRYYSMTMPVLLLIPTLVILGGHSFNLFDLETLGSGYEILGMNPALFGLNILFMGLFIVRLGFSYLIHSYEVNKSDAVYHLLVKSFEEFKAENYKECINTLEELLWLLKNTSGGVLDANRESDISTYVHSISSSTNPENGIEQTYSEFMLPIFEDILRVHRDNRIQELLSDIAPQEGNDQIKATKWDVIVDFFNFIPALHLRRVIALIFVIGIAIGIGTYFGPTWSTVALSVIIVIQAITN